MALNGKAETTPEAFIKHLRRIGALKDEDALRLLEEDNIRRKIKMFDEKTV